MIVSSVWYVLCTSELPLVTAYALLNIGNSEYSDFNMKTIFTFTKYCRQFLYNPRVYFSDRNQFTEPTFIMDKTGISTKSVTLTVLAPK